MDIKYLEKCMKEIRVKNIWNEDVEVENKSPLVMIGKGRQGAVFQVSPDICMKVFGNTEDCEREHQALSLGKDTNLFPHVFAKGKLYIVMEYIRGVDLREYLQSQPLTEELSIKLIQMLITFKKIGYERIDHHKRQIYLLPDGSMKVIDVARTIWRDRVYPYPRKLLNSLGEENKEIFLTHVQLLSPQLFEEWKHYIRMEEISRQICQVMMAEVSEKGEIKNATENLITSDDEKKHVIQLTGLVHKVFKEEWVKTMLLMGYDLDKIMKKIDEYWDAHKLGKPFKSDNYLKGSKFIKNEKEREKNKFIKNDIGREKSKPSFGGFYLEKSSNSKKKDTYSEKSRSSIKENYSIKNREKFW